MTSGLDDEKTEQAAGLICDPALSVERYFRSKINMYFCPPEKDLRVHGEIMNDTITAFMLDDPRPDECEATWIELLRTYGWPRWPKAADLRKALSQVRQARRDEYREAKRADVTDEETSQEAFLTPEQRKGNAAILAMYAYYRHNGRVGELIGLTGDQLREKALAESFDERPSEAARRLLDARKGLDGYAVACHRSD